MKLSTPSTQALLQALLQPEVKPHVLERWLAETNIERLAAGQYQLLPLLYPQMARIAGDHPWLPRLKGVHRRTWFVNQLAIKAAHDALAVLAAAGQPVLLIGPAALALTLYADSAARLIGAPLLLTPTTDRLAAIRALIAAGWQPSPQIDALTTVRFERWQAEHLFLKPLSGKETLQVRLCWHALPSAPSPAWSTQWFDRAVPLANESIQARTLDPTDQLLRSLTAGPALELIPLVDGHRLIAQSPIDWPRLVRLAVQGHLTLALAERLAIVQEIGALQLPGQLLAELKQTVLPNYVIDSWRLDQINPWERSAWQRFRLSYALFRQRAAAQDIPPHPGNFYDYLRTQFVTDSFATTFKRGLGRITTSLPLPHGY
jgi:hypothetical protein